VIALLVVARESIQAFATRALGVRILGSRLRARLDDPGIAPLFRAGWMIGVAGLAYKLCANAPSFILWEAATPEALASFNAAQRLLAPLGDAAWLFATPLIAAMSRSAAHDAPAVGIQLDGYLKLLMGMSAVVAVAGYFVAPFVLRLLYGELYATGPLSSVASFRWLALGYLFAVVSPVLVVGEMVRGHARALLFAALACLAVNLGANALAIPRHGAQGAAMVFAGTETIFFAVLVARGVARGDVRLATMWPLYLVPALLLAALLCLLEGRPAWQLALACAWGPASLWGMMRLPAQRAARASLAPTSVPRSAG
jgi:O-antigen/teichoic acid export membrane protein